MSFSLDYIDFRERAIQVLKDRINSEFVILTDEQIENGDDEVYVGPNFFQVTKHGFYEEYAIFKITKDEANELKFHGYPKGDTDDNVIVDINEIDTGWICYLADEF